MPAKIRVAIADDHQTIIDGYSFRISRADDIEIVGTASFGEDIEPMLKQHPADVLLLDIQMPTSATNNNTYPILHIIHKLLDTHENLAICVISMHNQHTLIRAVLDEGASGYILKDDQATLTELVSVVRTLVRGGFHLSQSVYQIINQRKSDESNLPISNRQLEVLSLCAAYPDSSCSELAAKLCIEPSTLRTTLSNIYLKLGVRTRLAAVEKARRMQILVQPGLDPSLFANL